MDDLKLLKKKIERLKKSQAEAESLLEQKSQELYELNKSLEELVETRTQQFQQARDEAILANQAKSQFLANMSHEIRTPLNGMLGFIGLLQKSTLSDSQKGQLETISKSGHLLLSIISDILEFSKIEAGKLELDSSEFNVKDTVEDVVDVMSNQAYEKNLELPVYVDEDIPDYLIGDEGRIRQVLVNLIGNAIKFTPTGEIFVKASLYRSSEKCSHILFEVIDTGMGIPEKKLESIFTAFEQADVSDTRKYGGTGLGLTISTTIVNMMGGDLKVESEESVGSKFYFTIPLKFSDTKDQNPTKMEFANNSEIKIFVNNSSVRSNLIRRMKSWGASSSDIKSFNNISWSPGPQENRTLVIDESVLNLKAQTETLDKLISDNVYPLILSAPKNVNELTDRLKDKPVGIIAKPIKRAVLFQKISERQNISEIVMSNDALTENMAQSDSSHLLLAEDNLVNQQVAIAMLKVHGYTVDIANNGSEAVEMFDPNKHALILMDCQMPVMDGFDATKEIKNRFPDAIIIAMTANAFKQTKEQCFEVGMNDFITKPVSDEALAEAISSNIAKHKKAI